MKLNQLRIGVRLQFHLDRSDVVVRTERPKVRVLHTADAIDLHYPLVGGRQLLLQFDRRTLQQNCAGALQQRNYAECDEGGDENRTDRIRNHPAELAHQDGRDDHTDAAQRICQDMQKDAVHNLTVRSAGRFVRMVVVVVIRGHRTVAAVVEIGLR